MSWSGCFLHIPNNCAPWWCRPWHVYQVEGFCLVVCGGLLAGDCVPGSYYAGILKWGLKQQETDLSWIGVNTLQALIKLSVPLLSTEDPRVLLLETNSSERTASESLSYDPPKVSENQAYSSLCCLGRYVDSACSSALRDFWQSLLNITVLYWTLKQKCLVEGFVIFIKLKDVVR